MALSTVLYTNSQYINLQHISLFSIYSEGDVIVQNDIQVAVDNYTSGNATLTCVSTGGPATTVIWTRDSEEVEGGITVLDDADNATYTHTLTLRENLGGLYQCNVSNNKPSEGSASIRAKGTSMKNIFQKC